ncbi:MAG: biotin--[Alistipes sp.]|nr:biotin--[acetyl-CoA-carboxylase] ligase [Alistipes sp.]
MIYHFDKLSSTNDEAASSAYAEGDIVWADVQSAGRGQRGHSWESRQGENVTFSAIFEPSFLPATKQFLLSEVVALAVVDALRY